MTQAEDRAHRIGQEAKQLNIKIMHLPGSIDELLIRIIMKKSETVSLMVDGQLKPYSFNWAVLVGAQIHLASNS